MTPFYDLTTEEFATKFASGPSLSSFRYICLYLTVTPGLQPIDNKTVLVDTIDQGFLEKISEVKHLHICVRTLKVLITHFDTNQNKEGNHNFKISKKIPRNRYRFNYTPSEPIVTSQ